MADEFSTLQENVVPYKVRITKVVWLDVNSRARQDGQPDLLPDVAAIHNSLRNLFGCPIGARGPIFRPDYGTFLAQNLQEPIHETTAARIRASAIQSIQKWEPRVRVIPQQTFVMPNPAAFGYIFRVSYIYLVTNEAKVTSFFLQAG